MDGRALNFDEIYTAYRERIVRYLSRLVGEHEAEDLAQETFMKAGRKLESFRGESQVLTWLYRIATNTAKDKLRVTAFRESVVQIKPSPEALEESEAPVEGAAPLTVEGQLIRQEMNACIRGVIDRLPVNYRTMIVLGNLEGFKEVEIADILGLSVGAAKIRLHRARERLKKELSSTCVFYRNEENELACDRKIISMAAPDS